MLASVTWRASHSITDIMPITVILMQTAPTQRDPFTAPVWTDIPGTESIVLVRNMHTFKVQRKTYNVCKESNAEFKLFMIEQNFLIVEFTLFVASLCFRKWKVIGKYFRGLKLKLLRSCQINTVKTYEPPYFSSGF